MFVRFNIILTCISVSLGFTFNGFGNVYRRLLKDIESTVASLDSSSIETKWMEQPLDHFDANNSTTWNMRYMERLDQWKKGGPIYLFMYGESEANRAFLQTGMMFELANETNGAMFLTEHRYYGKSKPFEELTAENLKHLNARQALEDNFKFLSAIKSEAKFENSKVVVVGGSYAGNLAAWMKLLYPDLVDAAIASSAPVLAKKDFHEYLEAVNDGYEQHGTEGCLENIKVIFSRYTELFQTKTGIAQLKEEENICQNTDMTKKDNQELFFLNKHYVFKGNAQYGSPENIKKHCEDIKNGSRVYSLHEENDFYNAKNDCYDYEFDKMIRHLKETDWYATWIYQTCTEYGYFQTTSFNKHPFTDSVSVDLFIKMCEKIFGPEFNEQRIDEGIKDTNEMYGGLKPNVTNVVFVNGDLDPWSRLSILEDISYDAPAKVIPRASHCRDLLSNKPTDHEELIEAREYIKYLIKKWIGVGNYKQN